jgi:aminoglycoside phosphotransferase (APT) family kinase protein
MNDQLLQEAATTPVAERHRFDAGALDAWMRSNVDGYAGPLAVEQFKGGQSNPTFRLATPSRAYVMRAKPGPVAKLLPSAHAVEREYRVMKALAGTEVPVALTHGLCEDEGVIGRAFYVMDCVDGRVLWDQSLPGMSNAERGAIYGEMNRVIAALHGIDVAAVGLQDFGRPGNYIARQISRWSKQYQLSETEKIPEMDRLIEWLPAHIPPGDETAVVHGDYRLDNLIFARDRPRVLAVLDWELSTIGHPLADFAYHCMSWHIRPGLSRGIGGLDLEALGIPGEAEHVRRYCAGTGRGDVGDWNFHLAYNAFRLAAIVQGIVRRALDGTASGPHALDQGRRVGPLAAMAWAFAQRSHRVGGLAPASSPVGV